MPRANPCAIRSTISTALPTWSGWRRAAFDGKADVWDKPLGGDRVAVLLLNRGRVATRQIAFRASTAGPTGEWTTRGV